MLRAQDLVLLYLALKGAMMEGDWKKFLRKDEDLGVDEITQVQQIFTDLEFRLIKGMPTEHVFESPNESGNTSSVAADPTQGRAQSGKTGVGRKKAAGTCKSKGSGR